MNVGSLLLYQGQQILLEGTSTDTFIAEKWHRAHVFACARLLAPIFKEFNSLHKHNNFARWALLNYGTASFCVGTHIATRERGAPSLFTVNLWMISLH